jgi:hypothetical protein
VRRQEGAEYPGMISDEHKDNGRAPEIAPLGRPSPRVLPVNSLTDQAKHAAAAPSTARVTAPPANADATAAPFRRRGRACIRLR